MKFVLFADDTNVLCKHDNYFSFCDLVNIELSKLSKWFSIKNYHWMLEEQVIWLLVIDM